MSTTSSPATATTPALFPSPLTIDRHFTTAGEDPFDSVEWDRRDSRILNPDGSIVFEMLDVEVPVGWDQSALDIIVSKYFRKAGVPQVGTDDTPALDANGEPVLGPERSVRQVLHRLANAWQVWGRNGGYFATDDDAEAFYDELVYMLLHQMAAPNSPQWFNTGLFEAYGIVAAPEGNWYVDPATGEVRESAHRYERSAANACYILSPDDQLVGPNSIMRHLENEARLFKSGSGSGANYSHLREQGGRLSGGGTSSGLMSFLKVMDCGAGAIKSGGTTRRAARMVIVDADHPDIREFIWCKAKEEVKVAALVAGGFSSDWQGEAYETVAFQNANHSVRLPVGFMEAVASGADWELRSRVDGAVVDVVPARELWREIATAAWQSADPGIQFDDILNDWNTAADTERVRGTNPCCFVGDTIVTTDAGERTISSLAAAAAAGRPLPSALAFDGDELRWAKITSAWVAGHTDRLIEVITANGHVLRCTPEHEFYVDGTWVPAGDLTVGDQLTSGSSAGVAGTDKVVSVTAEFVDEPVDVYDIEVAGHHNFCVRTADTDGVVVHNSEHTHVDFTACNLASLNLCAFYDDVTATFDTDAFVHATRMWTAVLEITVHMSHYPSEEVAAKTYRHRPLGLGYTNLGALLMRAGLAYDSDSGRSVMAAVTSLMLSVAYATSADMAAAVGPCDAFDKNRTSALRVLRNHRRATYGSLAARHKVGGYEELTVTPVALDHLTLAHTPFADLSSPTLEWADRMVASGTELGLRNMQVVVLAPTGTISFIMGADTTGVEPDFALVKFKKLAGGGYMRIVNSSVPAALRTLGYSERDVTEVMEWVLGTQRLDGPTPVNTSALTEAGFSADEILSATAALASSSSLSDAFAPWVVGAAIYGKFGLTEADSGDSLLAAAGFSPDDVAESSSTICGRLTTEGAPVLRPEHAAVFDCAVECGNGDRVISWEGHVRALGAVSPHVSGAVSKTVNMPNSATVVDIEAAHDLAYQLGVKCLAVYRDGSKMSQPLSSAGRSADVEDGDEEASSSLMEIEVGQSPSDFYKDSMPPRFKLPATRWGPTWRFEVSGEEVYLRAGEYPDGTLGEVFIDWGRQGSTLRGITGSLSIMVSQALQHGMPLEKIVKSLRGHMFEPSGVVTGHENLKMATSLIDAVVRILGHHYLGRNDLVQVPGIPEIRRPHSAPDTPTQAERHTVPKAAAPPETTTVNSVVGPETDAVAPATGERVVGASCAQCGSQALVRTGTCTTCTQCGSTSGCA